VNGALLRASALLVAGAAVASVAGCAATAGSTGKGAESAGSITVYAAASLQGTFTRLADDFEAHNPGTSVRLNFAGSSDLATQILQGAPADVFASADIQNMTRLSDADLIDQPASNFATNALEIAVPAANPASIMSFQDLARPGVRVVVCAPQVPCGAATELVEKASGTALAPVSEESSVTDVLGKVTAGEADAGLVYVTDVRNAGDRVRGIPFEESNQARNTYPIASVGTSRNRGLAQAFIAYVTSSEGRKIMADAGFGTP
jgi:molybdate transport system substrate-binding protein